MISTTRFILITLSFGTVSSCQTMTDNETQIDVEDTTTFNEPIDTCSSDSTIEQTFSEETLSQEAEKKDNMKKRENPQIEEIDIDIDVDTYIQDPFDDPNYIGTPCGDFENGKCTRHHHHKYDEPDSLKRF